MTNAPFGLVSVEINLASLASTYEVNRRIVRQAKQLQLESKTFRA